jgi:hypothetical protein
VGSGDEKNRCPAGNGIPAAQLVARRCFLYHVSDVFRLEQLWHVLFLYYLCRKTINCYLSVSRDDRKFIFLHIIKF